MRIKAGVVIVVWSAWVGCGGPAAKPCVSKVEGDLVKSAAAFKLDVYGAGVHCTGNAVPGTAGAPVRSQTFVAGSPIRLDVPNGKRALVLTTFSDAAATQPTGSACDEPELEPGGTVCLNLQVTPYVRGCPSDQTRCMDTCCAGGSCDDACHLTCSSSFADCNHDVADGCETNLAMTGQRLCGPDCISPTSCCNDSDCKPTMTPPACYAGTCPSPGASCTFALKSTATICGSTCCNSIGGTCASDCTLTCNGNNVDCNKDPGDGCESNPVTDPINCGGCGRVCAPAGTKHVVTPGCSGGTCTAVACEPGWRDCNHGKTPDDGCECAAPDCSPLCGCPITHDTGYKDTKGVEIPFYDCSTLDNYSETLANDAANAYGAKFPGTFMPSMRFSDANGTVDFVCWKTASDCTCWVWAAGGAYRAYTEGYANRAATCTPPLNTVSSTMPGAVPWH